MESQNKASQNKNFIVVSNFYPPELGAASNRVKNIAVSLKKYFDSVNVICPIPNYPRGRIFKNYRNKLFLREYINEVEIYRYWIYPTVSKNIFLRILSMFSFSLSLWLFVFNIKKIRKTNWVYIQNSPLLVSFSAIILFKLILNKKILLNVSDLWPLSAYELGFLKKGILYNLLELIEKFNYKNSNLILGQSNEIINHINNISDKKTFLYRNLQKSIKIKKSKKINKIIYAGLLGVAQGIYELIKNIDFKKIGVELDIYGDGNELKKILKYISENPSSNINYKGFLSKEKIDEKIGHYHSALVPLKTKILGAVPSKIFELIKAEVPIIYVGDKGEAFDLVRNWKVGYVSQPTNYELIEKNIFQMHNNITDYNIFKKNCIKIAETNLNFNKQFDKLIKLLK